MSPATEPLTVPALDLKAQYATIRDEIDQAVRRVVESQYFVLGPEVSGFEAEVAAYCEVEHGVGCASGSDALLLALMASGSAPGDEVITSPYSFFATAGAIWRTGASPVFVDIEPDTYNIDPARIEAAITPRTKAIIPVHLYGQAADMDPILEIADGARPDGPRRRRAGHRRRATRDAGRGASATPPRSASTRRRTSAGFGDAGMVTTDDPALARRVARLRVHGMEPKYHHHEVGFNSRIDALQAAVLRVKLRHLDAWTAARREVADRYRDLFDEHGLDDGRRPARRNAPATSTSTTSS